MSKSEATVLLVFEGASHHYLIYLDEAKADEFIRDNPKLTFVKLTGTLQDPVSPPVWAGLKRGGWAK